MIEVSPNLFVGSLADYEAIPDPTEYQVVLAMKIPCHQKALGYTTRAAPKDVF